MHIDWEHLQGVATGAGEWEESQLEDLYQTLVGITRLHRRDKTVDKLEMLFTLSQAVMMAKHTQASALEEELRGLAESVGRRDAKKEIALQREVEHLQDLLNAKEGTADAKEEHISYDWSSGWRIKKKEMEELLKQKNLEIEQFVDDLQSCEEERAALRVSVKELEARIEEATREITSLTSDHMQLTESQKHLQGKLAAAQGEEEVLYSHVKELTNEKSRIQQQYDDLSAAVEARVNQLEVAVREREEEVKRLKAQLHQCSLLSSSGMHQLQGEGAKVINLKKELKAREDEVRELSHQLEEAAKEIEKSALTIVQLKKAKAPPDSEESGIVSQLNRELSDARQQLQQLRMQLLAAEEDAQLHAQDLSTVISELQSHLAGEFSLADAVRELKEVRSQVRIKDAQLGKLTTLVNSLEININELLDENCQLREQLRIEPQEDIDLPGVKKIHWQESKDIIEQLNNQVLKLQDEKVSLKTKIYEMMRELSNKKSSLQLTTIQVPQRTVPESSSRQQLQSIEGHISHLSTVVNQFIQHSLHDSSEYRKEENLEALKEKCLRLESEKTSLERIIQKEFQKLSAKEELPRSPEKTSEHVLESEPVPQSVIKSPTAALDQLIRALDHLPPTAEELIEKLKNQVTFLMQECSKREEEISEREKRVGIYTTQFESLKMQVTDLNQLLSEEKHQWQTKTTELEMAVKGLEGEVGALQAQRDELQASLDMLVSGEPGVDAKLITRLAELKYDSEVAKRLRDNQDKIITSLHQQLKERLEALQQSLLQVKQLKYEGEKEQAILKNRIYQLENELTQSVPRTAADQTSAQLAAMTAKYRALLQTQSIMMQEKTQGEELEAEKYQLINEKEQLCQQLQSAKEKILTLGASLNLVGANEMRVQPQIALLSKQLAAVELRELTEKEKAEHSSSMYKKIKEECNELHKRVHKLEETLSTTSKMNLSLQTTEAELRHQLQGAILPQEYDILAKKMQDLMDEKVELISSVQHLTAVADVTETQKKQNQLLQAINEEEMKQLRQENQDLAAISGERSNIYHLHQEITSLKIKNFELLHQVEEIRVSEQKQQVEIFRLAQQLRDRERLHHTSSHANRARATRLYLIIRDLRQQYAGAVPLSQQEQLVESLEAIRQERNMLQEALHSAQHYKMESHITLRQLKVKQEALDDLKAVITSPKSSNHVSSWCTKLEEIRLKNVELDERVQMLEASNSFQKTQLSMKEQRISDLQIELIKLEKMWMDEQLVCDENEAELNEALAKHERRHEEAAANKNTLSYPEILDISLPLPLQLEEALDCLKRNKSLLEVSEKEIAKLKDENCVLARELKERNIEVIAREKVINELRLSSKTTEESVRSEREQNSMEINVPIEVSPENEGVKVSVEGLRERLLLSQGTVTHYQNLLAKEHEEKQALIITYKEELFHMTQKQDEAEAKVRDLQCQLDSIPTHDFSSQALKRAQATQIQSLEETLKVVERQLEEAKTQVISSEKKILQLERDLTIARREHAEEKDHLEVSGQVRIQQHQREVERLSGEINKLRTENNNMREEINGLRTSATRTPSIIMRTLVEKLRDQLIDKEKQLAKLNLVVSDMKENLSQKEAKHHEINVINVDKEVSEVTSRITESFKEKLEKVTEERDKAQNLYHEQAASLMQLEKKKCSEIECLNQELKNFTSENLKLKKQFLQQKNVNSSLRQRLENLEGKSPIAIGRAIESLQAKLEKMEGSEELEESQARKARSHEQVVRWDERKKLQKSMDKLKVRIKELETIHEDDTKKLTTTKILLGRIEREKLSLKHKLNNLSKVSMEKMCQVCLKTLNFVQVGNATPAYESPGSRLIRQDRASPSAERPLVKKLNDGDKKTAPTTSNFSLLQQSEQDENEVKIRLQLKKALEEKHNLESRLHSAVEEVAALRYRLQQKEEEEERLMVEKKRPGVRRVPGAALVIEYESRITSLEEQLRQKSRLLVHVKGVVQEAAAREETLQKEKESLLQKVTLLEGISEDAPSARLVHELRQARLTITRLQRQVDKLQPTP